MKKIILIIFIFIFNITNVYGSINTAKSYVIMDMTTNRVLDGKDYNNPMLIASITKIMTAIIAIESGKLDDTVKVDNTILKAYGSCIYIEVGEQLTLRDLLYGLMLRSGNDAALMIAKYVSGDIETFVDKMNDKASKIGMKNTMFNNPSGLDEDNENYSTSYDMALLTSYAMNNKEYRKIVKTKKYTLKTNYKSYIWTNKNKLLKYDYITGGKTGYTKKAKRTLVSTASKDNMNLVVVTLNDSDDWNTHTSLYEMVFNNYTSYKVLDKDNFNIIGTTKYKGNFYIKKDVYIPLKNNEEDSLISKIKLYDLKVYNDNDKVGYINIYSGNNLLYQDDIYIDKDNSKSSFIDKIKGIFND